MTEAEIKREAAAKKKLEIDRRFRANNPGYQNNYMKANYKTLGINLHKENDSDIIEYLQTLKRGQKDRYIKQLIRNDMAYKMLNK